MRLERFQRKSDKLYNFRCPFCGDSKKSKWKARGFVYVKKGGMFYKCHNCGHGTNMKGLISQVDPNTLAEYNMETFKEPRNLRTETPAYEFEAPKFEKKDTAHLHFKPISGPALEYAKERKLPDHMIETLFWVEDSQTLEYMDAKYEGRIIGHEPRLIIPFYNVNGKLFAIQARDIGDSKLRYITIKLDEEHPLVYGLEKVDFEQRVFIFEGPFDSMFIDNSIAVGGADLSRVADKFKDSVLVFDNQPRNAQLVSKMQEVIEDGHAIVVWPDNLEEKDINDMVLRGMSIPKILDVINRNTFKNTAALLALSQWRKV